MMGFAEWHAKLANHIISQISGCWKTSFQRCQHGVWLWCYIADHAGGCGKRDAKRISRVKHPFFVFLHIFAIGKRKPL